MQLPCANPERVDGNLHKHLVVEPVSGIKGSARSADMAAWLEEWLRHERQAMEDRHRSMLSQIGIMSRSQSRADSQQSLTFSARDSSGLRSFDKQVTEKTAGDLLNRVQFSNKQVLELSAELRTTRLELGSLRATIEASSSMQEPIGLPFSQMTAFEDMQASEAPPQPATEANGAKVEPGKERTAEAADTISRPSGDYQSKALKGFNGKKSRVTRDLEDQLEWKHYTFYQKFVYIVEHDVFEGVFGCLILLSAAALALEIQYEGLNLGYQISYPGYAEPSNLVWPWAEDTFIWVERCFTGLFTLELLIRLIAMRHMFCLDHWMYIDTFIVTFSLIALFGANPIKMNVVVLRILRVGRMLRILRIVRFIRFFDSLYLMIRSVQSSWSALIWSFILLMLVQIISGMIMCQTINQWIEGSSNNEVNKRLFQYFGTFTRTTLTMWEIMMANWISPARVLVNEISEYWIIFFLIYRCMLGFALLSVIRAVFIHETMKVADTDDEVAVFVAQRDSAIYAAKLKEAFLELDDSGDGFVNWQELSQIMQDDIMKNWLKSMQIDTSQVQSLFNLLDDGDGKISFEEFMKGIQKVKGPAKSIDVVMLRKMVADLGRKMDKLRTAQM